MVPIFSYFFLHSSYVLIIYITEAQYLFVFFSDFFLGFSNIVNSLGISGGMKSIVFLYRFLRSIQHSTSSTIAKYPFTCYHVLCTCYRGVQKKIKRPLAELTNNPTVRHSIPATPLEGKKGQKKQLIT